MALWSRPADSPTFCGIQKPKINTPILNLRIIWRTHVCVGIPFISCAKDEVHILLERASNSIFKTRERRELPQTGSGLFWSKRTERKASLFNSMQALGIICMYSWHNDSAYLQGSFHVDQRLCTSSGAL